MTPSELIGRWMLFRFRRRVAQSSVAKVAHRLRKDGVPFPVAWVILFGLKSTRAKRKEEE